MVSVDTVRLQGQLSGGLDYLKYTRSSVGNQLNGNLLGYGLGTVVQDHVFIDARAAMTQVSRPRRSRLRRTKSHSDIGSDAAVHNLPDPDSSVSLSADTPMANCVTTSA